MSKDTSLISMHPFVRKFVLSIIYTIKERGLGDHGRVVVDADLVPRGSERVMTTAARVQPVMPRAKEPAPTRVGMRRDMGALVAPIERVTVPRKVAAPPAQARAAPVPVHLAPATTPRMTAPSVGGSAIVAPAVGGSINNAEKYRKIAPLLNDPSVSSIECMSKGKELMIIRAGQKQKTRIVLSAKEIKAILDIVADEAHIPLLEGVFRANVKGFAISAVISDIIGSRFVIKKAGAYGLPG